ncbi:tetratricopeptide repeat protein [Rhodohalobacter sp. SW132]|uniref:serine/threonine-protein kinase n=1 Tax=Rhodohalobacter sp. SW132 TaxID=2293433 RepID=UPI000E26CD3E|nr:serine/threonine-protein kinase [Rhodohalobacter sp. SW132]REL24270.1 tetratricopeptide repeat protein [Rhodohalobacter sp. SW132]
MIGMTVNHYKILEKSGEGGMGVVYKAHDTKLNRFVALKFLPEKSDIGAEAHDRFLREARSIAQLNHPNICQIYGIEDDYDGNQFIVMEYIDGNNLADLFIHSNDKSDEILNVDSSISNHSLSKSTKSDQVLDAAIQIARGLCAAHQKGIIHRDIKPANIMITQAGEIKILDFGLAKTLGGNDLTREQSTLGTISYMSPEQIRGDELDHRTDIWSYGAVLYQLVTGRLPFGGDYEHSVMYSIINTDPPPLKSRDGDLPGGLEDIVHRCLMKEPDDRYATADELLDDLLQHAGYSQTGIDYSKNGSGKAESKSMELGTGKRKIVLAIGAILALILLLFTIFQGKIWVDDWISAPNSEFIHVAVLPFSNIGGDPGRQIFADGLVETITSQLSHLEQFQSDLWVVPSGEIRSNNILSAGEAYRMFGVNYAIAGSIQPIANRLRLTISLIDSKNLRQLNSKIIDVDVSQALQLHNESVEQLLAILNLELNSEAKGLIREGSTTNSVAFEYYIKGLGYLHRYEQRSESINMAIDAFEEALGLDPQFALASAGLGQAYWFKYLDTRDRTWIDRAKFNTVQAFKLNSSLLQARITLGLIHIGTGEYDDAIQNFNDALLSDPANAEAYRGLAEAYEYSGRTEQAEQTYKRAISLKPDHWAGYNALGTFYYRINQYENAKEQYRRVIEITPENYRGYMNLGSMYYFTDMHEQAKQMYEKSLELEKSYSAASNLGTLYYIEGRYAEAANMYETALELNDGNYFLWGNLAISYYYTPDQYEKSIPAYERAIELAYEQLEVNPNDAEVVISIAGYYARLGNGDLSRRYILEALDLAPQNTYVMYLGGSAYESLGMRHEALTWIKKAIEGGYSISEIQNQPELKELVDDVHFQDILENF